MRVGIARPIWVLIGAVLGWACSNEAPRPEVHAGGGDLRRAEQAARDLPVREAARPGEKGTMRDRATNSPFPVVSGKITYYDATGDGACMFGPSPGDLMVGAMNQPQYLEAEACGACAKITGPKGTIIVRIVDLCPECQSGHIDLSKEAFAKIADLPLGVVPVSWQYVACPVTGPIAYRFKEGSSQWWTAIQVRNTRWAVKTLEVKSKGAFTPIARESYNYFVAASGLGTGPYELRVTDVLGHQLVDTGIALKEAQVVAGAGQFP